MANNRLRFSVGRELSEEDLLGALEFAFREHRGFEYASRGFPFGDTGGCLTSDRSKGFVVVTLLDRGFELLAFDWARKKAVRNPDQELMTSIAGIGNSMRQWLLRR